MILGHCLLCASMEIDYQNGLLSVKVPGLQVELPLCSKHSQIAKHPNRWPKINRDLWIEVDQELERLEEAYFRGEQFSEETCLLCSGSGRLDQEQCWWCKGKGAVKPEPLLAWKRLFQGISVSL